MSSPICIILIIIDLELIIKALLGLLNLTRAQVLYIHKLIKVIVIHKNKNLIFVAFQIVALSLKCHNNS